MALPQNHYQQHYQSQQQHQSISFRNLYTAEGHVSQPISYFNPFNLQEHSQHPPYVPPSPGQDASDGVADFHWMHGIEPKKKRLKEQDLFENNSQISSIDFLQPRPVSTGLGLSLDNTRMASTGDSPLVSLIGDDIDLELQRQDEDIEKFLHVQGERLRRTILEKIQANQLQTLLTVEERIIKKLREKEAEVECINKKNIELEQRMEQLSVEAGAWQQRARYNENMITALQFNLQDISDRYCTLESSSGSHGYANHNSTSTTITFSSNGSPSDQHNSPDNTYGSPVSGSCITDDISDFRHKLLELETVMLGPDSDIVDSFDSFYQEGTENSEVGSWGQVMDAITKGNLKKILIACAKAVSDNDALMAQWLMDELRKMVSVRGEPMQRLGAYMLEGLVARSAFSGSSIYKSLRCKEPASMELLSYMHVLYDVCPYFKFGYMSANGAIAEAMKDEDRVHIIDFQISQGTQWITLIQAFAGRPGGPPHIRITGIDDPASAHARRGGLDIVGMRLSKLAKLFNVPFEFHSAAISGCDVQQKDLGIRRGEALAVNFAFMLHHMPDESVSTENHRDRLLRLVKGLSPKVVTLVEQESNTNTAAFFPRFIETLDYYNAMFESIDVTLPRQHKERINIEQHCLAREVVNILACEGAERVERHELLGKWRLRFSMAGFTPYPLSSLVNATIKTLLDNYSNRYRLEEKEGALYLGWMDRDLVASCAWK